MSRYSFVALLLFCVAFSGYSREGIEWLSTSYDFGTFKEAEGPQTGCVRMVNHGPEETIINRVKSTCGCTVAEYTDGVIAPGDTAEVRFTYDPTGRPGRFSKSIKVYTGIENTVTTIGLKGMVIGKPESLNSQYPIVSGDLRLSVASLILGDVIKGISRHEFIHAYNQGDKPIILSWEGAPRCLSIGVSSTTIEPGDLATISIYYNSRDDDNYGLNIHSFDLVSDDGESVSRQKVDVSVNVKADTSKLTAEQLKSAPRISIDEKVIELGKISSDKKVKGKFYISNEGVNALNLNRIYSFNKAFDVKRMPKKLKAGKSEAVEFELDVAKLSDGAFNVKVEVVSDDPLRPTETVRIVGEKISK